MIIRPLRSPDIEPILAIQTGLPQISQWSAADYDLSYRAASSGWVAEDAARVAGFIVARSAADEVEVLTLAVGLYDRRKGVGGLLLGTALDWGVGRGATKAYLEVRASNAAALKFYENKGFQVAGRRKRYYAGPVEDALVLARPLARP